MRLPHAIRGLAALLVLAPAAAFAQEDPEAVYAKLHRATLGGNSDEVLGFATARQKADLASKSKAEKDAVIQFMSKLMPQTYSITAKSIAPDGQSAVLRGTGVGEFMGKSQMYLTANFVKEGAAWKVDQWGWSSDKPPAGAQAAPAPKPAAPMAAVPKAAAPALKAAAPKPASSAKPAPPAPAPAPLGAAKPDCIYKAVMTSDDLKACGIGAR